jgi:hypothetical protein
MSTISSDQRDSRPTNSRRDLGISLDQVLGTIVPAALYYHAQMSVLVQGRLSVCLFDKPWQPTSKLSPGSGLLESKRRDPIVVVVPYRGLTLRHRLGGNYIPAARDIERRAAAAAHANTC